MARILLVDDDAVIRGLIEKMIGPQGHRVDGAAFMEEASRKAAANEYDVIFLDLLLPDGNGLELIHQLRQSPGRPEVIIITGHGDTDGAGLAFRHGAWDYVPKPFSLESLTLPLIRALQYRGEKLAARPPRHFHRRGIVGESPAILRCLTQAAQAAASEVNLLVSGPTGTGKELFAQAIHANSARSGYSFVVVDCAALPGTLLESTLFGHVKGAFTGADRARSGLIRHADGGTLFLDEVGELDPAMQKSFLRVLQEKRFRPVGSVREERSDFRLIAATNRDLDQMAAKGLFRQDLLFRIKSMSLHLPPLEERDGDITHLVVQYLAEVSQGGQVKGLSPEFMEMLKAYPWPGNVRQLLNVLDNALVACGQGPTLYPTHLPEEIRLHHLKLTARSGEEAGPVPAPSAPMPPPASAGRAFGRRAEDHLIPPLAETVRRHILKALEATGGNKTKAAQLLGISIRTLHRKLKIYG